MSQEHPNGKPLPSGRGAVTLKAEHVARLHGREGQAVLMFEVAKARIKAALFPQ